VGRPVSNLVIRAAKRCLDAPLKNAKDVSTAESWKALIAKTIETYGKLDMYVLSN